MHWIDPASLPATRGTVDSFIYNQHGDADGFLLAGGRQVHLPPHLSAELQRKLKVGDKVSVRALSPRGSDLLAAVSVTTPGGAEIVDHGPHAQPHHPPAPRRSRAVELQGTVRRTLYAPRGEVCGAVLAGGEIVRMRPKENAELAPYLAVGRDVTVWGDEIVVKGQRIVDLAHIAGH